MNIPLHTIIRILDFSCQDQIMPFVLFNPCLPCCVADASAQPIVSQCISMFKHDPTSATYCDNLQARLLGIGAYTPAVFSTPSWYPSSNNWQGTAQLKYYNINYTIDGITGVMTLTCPSGAMLTSTFNPLPGAQLTPRNNPKIEYSTAIGSDLAGFCCPADASVSYDIKFGDFDNWQNDHCYHPCCPQVAIPTTVCIGFNPNPNAVSNSLATREVRMTWVSAAQEWRGSTTLNSTGYMVSMKCGQVGNLPGAAGNWSNGGGWVFNVKTNSNTNDDWYAIASSISGPNVVAPGCPFTGTTNPFGVGGTQSTWRVSQTIHSPGIYSTPSNPRYSIMPINICTIGGYMPLQRYYVSFSGASSTGGLAALNGLTLPIDIVETNNWPMTWQSDINYTAIPGTTCWIQVTINDDITQATGLNITVDIFDNSFSGDNLNNITINASLYGTITPHINLSIPNVNLPVGGSGVCPAILGPSDNITIGITE
jgi:hypothetical protein